MSSCRELDNNRSALSAASAFAIATAGANEGTPTKEKYRRMSLASTGTVCIPMHSSFGTRVFWAKQTCLQSMLALIWADFRFMDSPTFGAVRRAKGEILLKVFSAGFPTDQRNGDKEFVIRRAATNRVLNVLRHWVSKHSPVNVPTLIKIYL